MPENRVHFVIELVTAVTEAIGADKKGLRIAPLHNVHCATEPDAADTAAGCTALQEGIDPLRLPDLSIANRDPSSGLVQSLRSIDSSVTLATHAGASLIAETMDLLGLRSGLQTLNRYTPDTAIHRGGKILTDLDTTIAIGGHGSQDIDLLCTTTEQHPLFVQVAFAPTEAWFMDAPTSTAPVCTVTDIDAAVKVARTIAWELDWERSPMH